MKPISCSRHVRVVAHERRHEVDQRVAGGDEEEVERPEPEEEPVAQHLAVRARRLAAARAASWSARARSRARRRMRGTSAPSNTNSTVNVSGEPTLEIRPPATPPSPTPRFIVTRCCANAACSRALGVSLEMSVDWLGQNPALPTPSIARRTYACHGTRTSGSSPKPAACRMSPEASTRRAPTRSMIGPIATPVRVARPTRLRSAIPAEPRCRSRARCAGRSRGTGRRRRFRTSSSPPPTWSSQTGRGSCGFRLRRYARTSA